MCRRVARWVGHVKTRGGRYDWKGGMVHTRACTHTHVHTRTRQAKAGDDGADLSAPTRSDPLIRDCVCVCARTCVPSLLDPDYFFSTALFAGSRLLFSSALFAGSQLFFQVPSLLDPDCYFQVSALLDPVYYLRVSTLHFPVVKSHAFSEPYAVFIAPFYCL